MGRRVLGGQRRTLGCGCGWTAKGHPDRLDTVFRLHKKNCQLAQKSDFVPSETSFNRENGMNNINVSKNGNFHIAPPNNSVIPYTY